jgi:hypothetical protein
MKRLVVMLELLKARLITGRMKMQDFWSKLGSGERVIFMRLKMLALRELRISRIETVQTYFSR